MMKRLLITASLLLVATSLSGCMDWWPEFGIPAGKQPFGEWNPIQDMHASPAFKDQEVGGTHYFPPGTITTSHRNYPFQATELDASKVLKNPVPVTADSLQYGKLMYETTCIVCHGADGKGNGYIVPKYPNPPDLTASRVRDWEDGQIYHVVTHGTGRMWGYKSQLKPMERWAAVNYVRALQRAEYPEPQDLEGPE